METDLLVVPHDSAISSYNHRYRYTNERLNLNEDKSVCILTYEQIFFYVQIRLIAKGLFILIKTYK